MGDDDRPELLHRLQRVHDGVPEREQRAGRRQGPGREGPRDALDPGRPVLLRRALGQPGDRVPAGSLHALRGCPVRAGLPGGGDGARRAGPQRDGLQPLHRHPLLLEQLSLQGAPLQFLQLHQGHARHPQARHEPGRHGPREGRDGEVHLLHAADQQGQDRCEARRARDSRRRRQNRLPAGLPRLGDRVRRPSGPIEPGGEGESRPAQLRAARRAEYEAADDLSGQGAQSESRSRGRANRRGDLACGMDGLAQV